ncbi:hypothetical protein ASG49_01630 [Marmoricola sp. Leaf446]|uniref:GrpB family protein n=1 Tax=Marmoricola sp. Leaf446 TaxID=1736379 RepID=UPI0006F2F217|nr:GrpB family protein [Marmoricola sp. Leaf446]KQT93711.1 hypothetical protein ASG49_01630 [Marmoricola sp. Leaf446]
MPSAEEITAHHDVVAPPGRDPYLAGTGPAPDVEVVAADPSWPEVFQGLRTRLVGALGDRALRVEHVGSTAVPGLAAKPVIDVDLVVADPADEAAWLPDLERTGLVLVVREPWWQEHRCLRGAEPACHVHVFGPDAVEPVRHRIFRDRLREVPEERALYEAAKQQASRDTAAVGGHSMDYNARKQAVVRDIYDRAFVALGLLPAP